MKPETKLSDNYEDQMKNDIMAFIFFKSG